jgi:hydrogenase nickel incorporation protein HypA/HybF
MHEAAIVDGLIKILCDQAAKHDIQRISRVNLKVGKLKAVEPQALVGCFEIFAEGTVAEGAELAIDHVPAFGHCQACGADFEIQRFRFRCPHCQGADVTLTGGEELYIESFET